MTLTLSICISLTSVRRDLQFKGWLVPIMRCVAGPRGDVVPSHVPGCSARVVPVGRTTEETGAHRTSTDGVELHSMLGEFTARGHKGKWRQLFLKSRAATLVELPAYPVKRGLLWPSTSLLHAWSLFHSLSTKRLLQRSNALLNCQSNTFLLRL